MTSLYFDHVFEKGADGRCDATMLRRRGGANPLRRCGAERNSVLHDPTHPEDGTPRHWCSILDAGGDCMHLEGVD